MKIDIFICNMIVTVVLYMLHCILSIDIYNIMPVNVFNSNYKCIKPVYRYKMEYGSSRDSVLHKICCIFLNNNSTK